MKFEKDFIGAITELAAEASKKKYLASEGFLERIIASGILYGLATHDRSPLIWGVVEKKEDLTKAVVPEPIKNWAHQNLIINLVTALEVFFKDLIVENKDKWHSTGFSELLSQKISLNEAYDLFKISNINISKELIVARFSSFQRIDSIDHVFTCLT